MDCLCPRTLDATKLFEPLDALVASLQPRETFHQSSDLAALLQQFAFHSLVIFHFFSLTILFTIVFSRIHVSNVLDYVGYVLNVRTMINHTFCTILIAIDSFVFQSTNCGTERL